MPDIFISEEPKKENLKPEPHLSESPKTKTQKGKFPGSTHNPLAAFCYYPENIDFETKESKEKVVLLLRQHPITNVKWILIAILMILAPVVLGAFPILSFLPSNFQFIAVLIWYLVTTAFVIQSFLTWFFNVYIITDERIVDIDFYSLIYKMGGVVRTLFNYGDVLIQTASEVPNFEFLAVPKPDQVAKILQDLRIEEEQEKLEGRIR